jgi:hypothetical protein
MFLKIKTVCLHVIIPEMPSFSMRPAKYFYDNPLPKYLDPKTVLIYRPHPVCKNIKILQKNFFVCAIIGGVTIFPRSPRTMQNEKKF